MLDIIHCIGKIQLQSDIIHHSNNMIKFPRFEKRTDESKTLDNMVLRKLNRTTVASIIEKARKNVIFDLEKLGIDTSKLNFHCQVKPVFEQNIPEVDSDLDSDSDEIDLLFENNNRPEDNSDDEQVTDMHNDYLSGIQKHIITGY